MYVINSMNLNKKFYYEVFWHSVAVSKIQILKKWLKTFQLQFNWFYCWEKRKQIKSCPPFSIFKIWCTSNKLYTSISTIKHKICITMPRKYDVYCSFNFEYYRAFQPNKLNQWDAVVLLLRYSLFATYEKTKKVTE